MSDDWRVGVSLPSRSAAEQLGETLKSGAAEHHLDTGYAERVIVSVDAAAHELFLYAGSREQAETAAATVSTLDAAAQTELRHWHPVAEAWEDPNTPLPSDQAGISAEQRELTAEEDAESERLGVPDYEVRIELPSHQQTRALEHKLRAEGIPSLRRWRYLLIGAEDEAAARKLAQRLQGEVPADSRVTVEGTAARAELGAPVNPFAVLGGLGG